MKKNMKILIISVVIALSLIIVGLTISFVSDSDVNTTTSESKVEKENKTKHISTKIKTSPDKYTWYIKDYVGKNCASIGYTSIGGDRLDKYGASTIKLVLVSNDGSYIDINDSDDLKKYVVTEQSVDPNTELKLTFMKDSKGEEYDSLISSQSIEEIVLNVKKVK